MSLFHSTQVEGVDLGALFNRLPKTRAAADDALRQVLALARQQPPPEPSSV